MRICIASNNAKKRKEIEAILNSLEIEIVPAADTRFTDVLEDGDSFAANAQKKAEAFAQLNHLPALADDSGLCVDALNGAPGIYSSRYAGESANDAENNAKLLHELKDQHDRSAHFACAIHLAFPDASAPITAEGQVNGQILETPDGDKGFGYDPIFFCPELGKSFANATAAEKASVSHRGRALSEFKQKLQAYLG